MKSGLTCSHSANILEELAFIETSCVYVCAYIYKFLYVHTCVALVHLYIYISISPGKSSRVNLEFNLESKCSRTTIILENSMGTILSVRLHYAVNGFQAQGISSIEISDHLLF